jgi:hypothetical protein
VPLLPPTRGAVILKGYALNACSDRDLSADTETSVTPNSKLRENCQVANIPKFFAIKPLQATAGKGYHRARLNASIASRCCIRRVHGYAIITPSANEKADSPKIIRLQNRVLTHLHFSQISV